VISQERQAAILSHACGNPYAADGNQLYNFITKSCVPQEHVMKIMLLNVSIEAPVFELAKSRTKMYMSGGYIEAAIISAVSKCRT